MIGPGVSGAGAVGVGRGEIAVVIVRVGSQVIAGIGNDRQPITRIISIGSRALGHAGYRRGQRRGGRIALVGRPVVSGQISARAIVVAGAAALLVLQLPAGDGRKDGRLPNHIMTGIQLVGGLPIIGAIRRILTVECRGARAGGGPVGPAHHRLAVADAHV